MSGMGGDMMDSAMMLSAGKDPTTGQPIDQEAMRRERLRRQRDLAVSAYTSAKRNMAEAERMVAQYVLDATGFKIGDLVREGHCVYRVISGSGWVNPMRNEPNMVLTCRRTYRGGDEAATSSTIWASSCRLMTAEECEAWLLGK